MSFDVIKSIFMLLFCGYFAFGSTNKTTVQPREKSVAIQDYFLVNDQWRLNFRIVGMSCHSRIVVMMGHIFGIKFNKKTCSVAKGVYVFNNIDYDIVDHVFLINREYGRVLRKIETFSTKGTIVCLELEIMVSPKNK